MEAQIDSLHSEALAAISAAANAQELDAARVKYMGRAGAIPLLSEGMRNVPKEDKARVGKALNALRSDVAAALDARQQDLAHAADHAALSQVDLTLPGISPVRGSIHPLTQLLDKAVRIFRRMGFTLAEGPDIETEWHCFDALNTPKDHPARNEQEIGRASCRERV